MQRSASAAEKKRKMEGGVHAENSLEKKEGGRRLMTSETETGRFVNGERGP